MSNGVYTRRDGPHHRTVVSTSFDDATYAPEMDDMLEDRLEEARQNRTGFYRKMLASRSRPLDDYSVSRRTTYRSGGSPVKEPSISDTVQSGPLPQVPEPHSSWRFYTSYDNGEWKRHCVPVHKEEEEILREPTKVVRRVRETERSTHSPPVESSLRRMRQSGGPLVACLQPRPRRSSEGQRTSTTTVQTVNGQPLVVGGDFEGQFGGQFDGQLGGMSPEEWEKIVANGSVVRRFSDGGTEYLILQEDPIQGSMKQECTTKYTSTVKVTQPKGGHHVRSGFAIEQAKGGVAEGVAGGGVEGGQGLVKVEEAGVRKSSRPRIYGFQEKIIIPTKYKNMENNGIEEQKVNDINTGQLKTREETTVKKSSLVEDGLKGRDRRVGVGVGVGEIGGGLGGGRIQGKEESQSEVVRYLKPGSTAMDRSMEGKTVKVVVMNSGSDVESDRKSSEPLSSGEENEAKDTTAARKSSAGISDSFIQMPNLFQDGAFPMEDIRALHESLHAKLLPGGVASVKDGSVSTIEDDKSVVPNQRVFSKDEETFSEVGPGGAKCDGKVLRTYEVITTTDDDDSTVENKPLPTTTTKEVIIVPIEAGNQRSPFLKRRAITSSAGEDREIRSDTREQSGRHFSSEQETLSPARKTTIPAVSPKADDKKAATDIFEQTGSLFKTITPRPRNIREKESSVFAAREEHLRKAAENTQPKLGSVTSRTIRISSNHHDDLKPESDTSERVIFGRVGTGVSPVRTQIEHVSTVNRSSNQLRPSGPAEGKTLIVRDSSFGTSAATEDGGGLSQPNTNSGVRVQHGWSAQTQTTKSNPRSGQIERDWEVQVALKE